jgi:hypothetical protein
MAKPNKIAVVLNQNVWATSLAESRAEESGVRAPTEESNHKGFIVRVPNAPDILAWCLDEIGRQEGELGAEAQCWQDHSTKKKQLAWIDNCSQITENISDLLAVCSQLMHAGVKLPKTLPWNENGLTEIDMTAITQEALQELAEEANPAPVEEVSETPTED